MYSKAFTVELESVDAATGLIKDFKQTPRTATGAARIYASRLLSGPEAKRAWQAREARRQIIEKRPDLMGALSLCSRSYCLYLNREPIFFARSDGIHITELWPKDVLQDEVVQRLGGQS
eukprot:6465633-Amphidinium_carterae.1